MATAILFSSVTIAVLFSSAYINHRLFRNSESLFKMLIFCAAFTTVAEFTIMSSIDKFKDNSVSIAAIHIAIICLWLFGMWIDNLLNKKIGDNCNDKPTNK
jgi:predicted permease